MEARDQILCEGKHLRFLKRGGWEMVTRKDVTGIVGIVAVTDNDRLVLVEQFRPPLGKRVIEIPAGLAGDVAGHENEELLLAAKRELREETGYEAAQWRMAAEGATSAGLCDEIVTLFVAGKLKKV